MNVITARIVKCNNYEGDEFIVIGLRINESKIECINNTLD